MKRARVYHPQPPEEEHFPPCPSCGSEQTKTLDNWLIHPCLRVIQCRGCGRRVMGEGETIAQCKENALMKWQDPAAGGIPPWEEGSAAAGLTEED